MGKIQIEWRKTTPMKDLIVDDNGVIVDLRKATVVEFYQRGEGHGRLDLVTLIKTLHTEIEMVRPMSLFFISNGSSGEFLRNRNYLFWNRVYFHLKYKIDKGLQLEDSWLDELKKAFKRSVPPTSGLCEAFQSRDCADCPVVKVTGQPCEERTSLYSHITKTFAILAVGDPLDKVRAHTKSIEIERTRYILGDYLLSLCLIMRDIYMIKDLEISIKKYDDYFVHRFSSAYSYTNVFYGILEKNQLEPGELKQGHKRLWRKIYEHLVKFPPEDHKYLLNLSEIKDEFVSDQDLQMRQHCYLCHFFRAGRELVYNMADCCIMCPIFRNTGLDCSEDLSVYTTSPKYHSVAKDKRLICKNIDLKERFMNHAEIIYRIFGIEKGRKGIRFLRYRRGYELINWRKK